MLNCPQIPDNPTFFYISPLFSTHSILSLVNSIVNLKGTENCVPVIKVTENHLTYDCFREKTAKKVMKCNQSFKIHTDDRRSLTAAAGDFIGEMN